MILKQRKINFKSEKLNVLNLKRNIIDNCLIKFTCIFYDQIQSILHYKPLNVKLIFQGYFFLRLVVHITE